MGTREYLVYSKEGQKRRNKGTKGNGTNGKQTEMIDLNPVINNYINCKCTRYAN